MELAGASQQAVCVCVCVCVCATFISDSSRSFIRVPVARVDQITQPGNGKNGVQLLI
jgi:hypothetical protein